MKQNEIILLADASGISVYGIGLNREKFIHYLEVFAKLVEQHEREACAKVCDHMAVRYEDMRGAALESAAESIRLRGQA